MLDVCFSSSLIGRRWMKPSKADSLVTTRNSARFYPRLIHETIVCPNQVRRPRPRSKSTCWPSIPRFPRLVSHVDLLNSLRSLNSSCTLFCLGVWILHEPKLMSSMQSSKDASKAKLERSNSVPKHRVEKAKPVRRRAPAACQSCRARKVRCDVSEGGSPCMNCRADNLECIVTIGKTRVYIHPISRVLAISEKL